MVPSQPRLDVGKLKDERAAEEFANRQSGFGGVWVLWGILKSCGAVSRPTSLMMPVDVLELTGVVKKNFVSQGTLDTIDQSRRNRLTGRAELSRKLRHKNVRALRVDREAYV